MRRKVFCLAVICSFFLMFSNIVKAKNISGSGFNPALSLILDGRYTSVDNDDFILPGFPLGGEAGSPQSGFSLGHNELTVSANIDDKFYGFVATPIVYQDGEASIELEEAYIETLSIGRGLTVKAGKFFSGAGYLNAIHDHAHDFTDRPLVYDALFGGHLVDTGAQVKWVAPMTVYLSLGGELTSGSEFPGGENHDNNTGRSFFIKTGGDINMSSSWQLGSGYYASEFDLREGGGHDHGAEEESPDSELQGGEVDIRGIDFVYKWSPNGNPKERNFKLQGEYFERSESGRSVFSEGDNFSEADYHGDQYGYYLQGVYQFMPAWRIAVRYDFLNADNNISLFENNGISEEEFLEESGIGGFVDDITRYSAMVDYSPSHFSRLRLQYNTLDNGIEESKTITLQYIMSLGAHGAHTY